MSDEKVKVIANYLPQFHRIPENDMWWGKGFTDWDAVKKCAPLFNGHNQPNIPLNKRYYSLDNPDEIRWQAELANKYGIYGFGIYHYWFSSEQLLLEKPAELILENSDININYMFIWDNNSWKRTWSNIRNANDIAPEFDHKIKDKSNMRSDLLAEIKYGNEDDWKKHFDYLLPFFNDKRYIRINNKPVFIFFNPGNDEQTLRLMCKYWNNLAVNAGLNGLTFISKKDNREIVFDYSYIYQPLSRLNFVSTFQSRFHNYTCKIKPWIMKLSYDKEWKKIINFAKKCNNNNLFYGAFLSYDDSPRRGKKAKIIEGTPDKFGKYMTELLNISQMQGKEFVFLTAWNEWGEGAYLEPDEKNGYAYLETLKKAIDTVNNKNK